MLYLSRWFFWIALSNPLKVQPTNLWILLVPRPRPLKGPRFHEHVVAQGKLDLSFSEMPLSCSSLNVNLSSFPSLTSCFSLEGIISKFIKIKFNQSTDDLGEMAQWERAEGTSGGQCEDDYLMGDLHLWSINLRTSRGEREWCLTSPGHAFQEEFQLPHTQLGIMCLGHVFNMQVQFNAPCYFFHYKKLTLCILGI